MVALTEGRHPAEFILSEAAGMRSRDTLVIAESQTIEPGEVLARKAVAASVTTSAAAVAGGTGNATIAMADPAVSSKAKNGTYRGVCLTATTVRWEDPSGVEIGISTHGAAFNKEVKFTITAGGTPNVAGDAFEIVVGVEEGDYQYVAFDPTATDGAEIAAAVAIYGATTGSGETAKIAGVRRDAEVNGKIIGWPSGISAVNKAKGVEHLAAAGIIVR